MSSPLKLAILISGRGTNMLEIARHCLLGRIKAEVVGVIADRDASGLESADFLGLPTVIVDRRRFADQAAFEMALATAIEDSGATLLVLAGFMRILSGAFTARYAGRMLNIHPSLLPAYKGLHTHRRVLEAGDNMHGVSVHYVTAELDGGPLIAQARVPVLMGDNEDRLSARVQQQEHKLYPQVIKWIADGRLVWRNDQPEFDGQPLLEPLIAGENAHVDAEFA